MLLSPLVLLLVLVVGMMIGSIGIGGVLQVPVLHFLGGVPIHAVIPACMMAYLLPGIVGGLVYHRHGSLHGPSAWQVCLGAVPGALLGAWLLPLAPGLILEVPIALLILFSGVDALIRRNRGADDGGGLGCAPAGGVETEDGRRLAVDPGRSNDADPSGPVLARVPRPVMRTA